ncbi:MAG: hypothetical protein JW995_14710 [Melioribacteraceae bacterium]|nr:hypothetical protein [Melioribacteraceae bacterium]
MIRVKKIFLSVFLIVIELTTSVGADDRRTFIIVAQDGSGDYSTITEAIHALPMFVYERVIVFIRNGVYNEKIRVEQDNITLYGESRNNTIIQFSQLRTDWIENKDAAGPAVINLHADDIILDNLTIINTQSLTGPHAFAIYGTGTRIIITNCNVISKGGDTVSLWNYKNGMYYHSNCYFEGAVDFVCPRGWCFIKDSKFYEVKETAALWHAGGYNENQKFVILSSEFDGVKNFKLGRHHYEAQFYLINCRFSSNMADRPIYRVTYEDTTRNRPFNWGERYYFYNCSRAGENYRWFSDNISESEFKLINAAWTFDNKWFPESLLPTQLQIASRPEIVVKNKNNKESELVLKWIPGSSSESHLIYFGVDKNVGLISNESSCQYKFRILNSYRNFYFRIDVVASSDTIKGLIWEFDTSEIINK